MISTQQATLLAVINLALAGALAAGSGRVISWILRRSWGLRTALLDAGLGTVVAVASLYVSLAISPPRDIVVPVLALSAGSAVARHGLLAATRR